MTVITVRKTRRRTSLREIDLVVREIKKRPFSPNIVKFVNILDDKIQPRIAAAINPLDGPSVIPTAGTMVAPIIDSETDTNDLVSVRDAGPANKNV